MRRKVDHARLLDARNAATTLLQTRAPDKTVCPSEVARLLAKGSASQDWRDLMPIVHAAVDELLSDGAVQLSWKGKPLAARDGPYRIKRKEPR